MRVVGYCMIFQTLHIFHCLSLSLSVSVFLYLSDCQFVSLSLSMSLPLSFHLSLSAHGPLEHKSCNMLMLPKGIRSKRLTATGNRTPVTPLGGSFLLLHLVNGHWAPQPEFRSCVKVEVAILMSLAVSVAVKQHWTMLRHWSQFVPNTSTDIRGHETVHQSTTKVDDCKLKLKTTKHYKTKYAKFIIYILSLFPVGKRCFLVQSFFLSFLSWWVPLMFLFFFFFFSFFFFLLQVERWSQQRERMAGKFPWTNHR